MDHELMRTFWGRVATWWCRASLHKAVRGPAHTRAADTCCSCGVAGSRPGFVRGRGLRTVERLADSWGTIPTADGKVVWADFDRTRPRLSLEPVVNQLTVMCSSSPVICSARSNWGCGLFSVSRPPMSSCPVTKAFSPAELSASGPGLSHRAPSFDRTLTALTDR